MSMDLQVIVVMLCIANKTIAKITWFYIIVVDLSKGSGMHICVTVLHV